MSVAYAERVERAGAGAPWLAMVHGMSQDRRVFDALVPAFADRFRLLLVDLPGHGESRAMPGPYGLAEHAAAVAGAIEAAGVESLHFWGTHTGAGVALVLAARDPAPFRSLVLEGAVMPGEVLPSVGEALARAQADARERGMDAARAAWWARSEWFRVMREDPQRCRAATHRAMIEEFEGAPWLDPTPPAPVEPIRDRLAAIDVPALIVNGEHELADFVGVAEVLERGLPRSSRVRIPGGGGFPLWERPEVVAPVVRAFLDAVDADAG